MKYFPIKLNSLGVKNYLRGKIWFTKKEIENLERIEKEVEGGSLVSLYSKEGHFLGQGYFNSLSFYPLKLLTKREVFIESQFFEKRFKEALDLRKSLFPSEECFRLVFGEGDFLSGLIIDIYKKVGVIQIYTLGMEKLLSFIVSALKKVVELESVVLKNDLEKRKEEGLPLYVDFLFKKPEDPYLVEMDGIKFLIPLEKGQKTGFFLDQRENRRFLKKISSEKVVIDAFSYIGGFSFYALRGGAKKAYLIDRSTYALDLALEIAKFNQWKDRVILVKGEVFQFLKNPLTEGEILIVDPPALIKSKKDFTKGVQKYRELYSLALRYFSQTQGFIFLFSCSSFLKLEKLRELLKELLRGREENLRIIKFLFQAGDHPFHPQIEETNYLKGLVIYQNG